MKTILNYLPVFSNKLIFILFVFFHIASAQNHPLLDSDHIPLMGFDHSAHYNDTNKVSYYDSLKSMGLEGVMFGEVDQYMYDAFEDINDQLKLIPYQSYTDARLISRYTDAIYTSWQAHDTSQSNIKAALTYNSTIGERLESGSDTIRTQQGADEGLLIEGPGYRQRIFYSLNMYNDNTMVI